MKTTPLIFLSLLLSAGCNTAENKSNPARADSLNNTQVAAADTSRLIVLGPATALENRILNKIAALPEFKTSNRYIDSLTGHAHGLSSMIFKPTDGFRNYYVQVGYDNKERFETYYTFYVDSVTMNIRLTDVLEGDVVSLEEWRKREAARNK